MLAAEDAGALTASVCEMVARVTFVALSASMVTVTLPAFADGVYVSVTKLLAGAVVTIAELFDHLPAFAAKRTLATVVPAIDVGTLIEKGCVVPRANEDGELTGFVTAKSIPGAVTVTVWLAVTLTAPAALSHSATTTTVPAAVAVRLIGTTTLPEDGAIPVAPVVPVVEERVPAPVLVAAIENRID
jgi:hypothetical protein